MAVFAEITSAFREHYRAWLVRVLLFFILISLFFVAFGGVSHGERFRVERVSLDGVKAVPADLAHAFVEEKLKGNYYFVYARNNSFLFPGKEIESGLLQMFPRLKSVTAVRTNPREITIAMSERKPYALWCGEVYVPEKRELSDCYFVDDTGFVFDHAPIFSEGVYREIYSPLLRARENEILRSFVPSASFVYFDTIVRGLEKEIGDVVRIEAKEDGEYTLVFKKSTHYPVLAGVLLRFHKDIEPAVLVKNLRSAIPVQFPDNVPHAKKLNYIDMRFGNKIFFGFEE